MAVDLDAVIGRIKNALNLKTEQQDAVVSAVNAEGTVDLNFGATDVEGVSYLQQYTPTVGDVVAVLMTGKRWLVIGKIRPTV